MKCWLFNPIYIKYKHVYNTKSKICFIDIFLSYVDSIMVVYYRVLRKSVQL